MLYYSSAARRYLGRKIPSLIMKNDSQDFTSSEYGHVSALGNKVASGSIIDPDSKSAFSEAFPVLLRRCLQFLQRCPWAV